MQYNSIKQSCIDRYMQDDSQELDQLIKISVDLRILLQCIKKADKLSDIHHSSIYNRAFNSYANVRCRIHNIRNRNTNKIKDMAEDYEYELKKLKVISSKYKNKNNLLKRRFI